MKLKLLTMNIHKGRSLFNQRMILAELRQALRSIHADIVFLQEVRGNNGDADANQWEYLADELWSDFAYGKNAVYEHTHHGNAILSKFPIQEFRQQGLPSHRFEQRGYLEATVHVPGATRILHLVNVHLGLFGFYRRQQIDFIHSKVETKTEARILAGDFNDWAHGSHGDLVRHGWLEGHHQIHGSLAKSFPSFCPILRLDRIYLQSLLPRQASVLSGKPWSQLSDHLPLVVEVDFE